MNIEVNKRATIRDIIKQIKTRQNFISTNKNHVLILAYDKTELDVISFYHS